METTSPSEANLTVSDAVRITRLSADTIRRYSNDGKLRTFRTPANHRRFTEKDVRGLIHEKVNLPALVVEADEVS
jgi:predicted site-specific integrase-resolvase